MKKIIDHQDPARRIIETTGRDPIIFTREDLQDYITISILINGVEEQYPAPSIIKFPDFEEED